MKPKTGSHKALLAVIGVDIGKGAFHIVGFGVEGKIAFRRGRSADLVDQRLQRRGLLRKNDLGAYSLNSLTAKADSKGSYDIQSSDCDRPPRTASRSCRAGTTPIRLYRQRRAILGGGRAIRPCAQLDRLTAPTGLQMGRPSPVHRRSARMCQCQEPGRRCSSWVSERSSKPAKSAAIPAKSQ
jgi:hypothetical protein